MSTEHLARNYKLQSSLIQNIWLSTFHKKQVLQTTFTRSLCKELHIYSNCLNAQTQSKYVFRKCVFMQVWAWIWTNCTEAERKLQDKKRKKISETLRREAFPTGRCTLHPIFTYTPITVINSRLNGSLISVGNS